MAEELDFESALATVAEHSLELSEERVSVREVAGRRLARDVRAVDEHPAVDNSAMDGYAVRAADSPGNLRLVGESRAGAPFSGSVGPGEAVAIATGGRVPGGADAIVPIEKTSAEAGRVSVGEVVEKGAFVRLAGGDLPAGGVVLGRGSVVQPHMVAPLAAAGHATLACERRAAVAVLSTGDELVEPGAPRVAEQVVNSNGPGLAAQARSAGAVVVAEERARDEREATAETVSRLLDGAGEPVVDLLVTVGGVSVGRHDHVRPALEAAGVEQVFWGVALRPGHPLWFGVRGEQRVLGLPGNPVSAAVCFHVFGRAVLGRPGGWDLTAELGAPFGPNVPRTQLIRCRWRGDALEPLPRQDSHAVTSMAGADVLALIPPSAPELPAGTRVRYQPLA